MFTFKQDVIPEIDDLKYLYTPESVSFYDNVESLYSAIAQSDYCITAWDEDLLIGIIRSSGDANYVQLITDFFIHKEYVSQGISSQLINLYLNAAETVKEYILIPKIEITSPYMITWLQHKGFLLKSQAKGFQVFYKSP